MHASSRTVSEPGPQSSTRLPKFGKEQRKLLAEANEAGGIWQKLPETKLTIIYARFSTLEQKLRSIERQKDRCCGYIKKHKLPDHNIQILADKGYSGRRLRDRPDAMTMMELVMKKKVSDIVIEAFDRLSRHTWDATRIGETLEAFGVRLHIWNLDRAVSRQEFVDEAKRAEADQSRRWESMSDGVYNLVREGGIPGKKPFAFKKGTRPGFPVICEQKAPAVERLFELAKTNTDRETANQLELEGFISPNGSTQWTAAQVAAIRSNLIYIGVINYRVTDQESKRVVDEEAPLIPGDFSVRTKDVRGRTKRQASEWIVGYNSDYAIIEEEDFLAVAMARSQNRRGTVRVRTAPIPDPFRNPVCDCPGRPDNQSFIFCWHNDATPSYQCSLGISRGACLCRIGQSAIPIEDVQRVVVSSIRKHALSLCKDDDFKADFLERVDARAARDNLNRNRLQAEHDELDHQINRTLRDAIKSGFDPDRVRAKVESLEDDLKRKKIEIARLPVISVNAVAIDNNLTSIAAAYEIVEKQLPFRPQGDDHAAVTTIISALVPKVVIRRETVLAGRAEIEVFLDVDGYVSGAHQTTEQDWVIDRTEVRGTQAFRANAKSAAALEALAASAEYALTDAQWELLKDHLPDMNVRYNRVSAMMPTRRVADAAIFKFRTGIEHERLPTIFGDPLELEALIVRFVRVGAMAEMVRILSAADSKWPAGLDLDKFRPSGKLNGQSCLFGNGQMIAAKLAQDGTANVTTPQFEAVRDLITPELFRPRYFRETIDPRTLVNGVLIKLRSGAAWHKMPPPWQKGSDFRREAKILGASGVWDQMVARWRKAFPEMLIGLPVEDLNAWGASVNRDRQKTLEAVRRGAQNTKGIFAKAAEGLSACQKSLDIRLKGTRVRAPDHKVLMPDLCAGFRGSAVGATMIAPIIVAQRTFYERFSLSTTQVQRFRCVRGLRHILLVCTDRRLVAHWEKRDGKWTARRLVDDGVIAFPDLDINLSLAEVYANASM
ncbi:hypothetical protein XI06_20190 [Bradyrhizobium sp. CCBAU 11434]|nr:hypothetical protein [Bradyrhizobium sp. CCBAU 11434]